MMWQRILDERIEEGLLTATMVVMVILISMQALSRYLIGSSFDWGTELAIYLHIWQIWIGASLAIKKQEHIRIDVFVKMFPSKMKLGLDLCALFIWFGFALFLAIQGTIFVFGSIYTSGQTSPTLDIGMWIPYLAVPLAGALMAVRLVQQMYHMLKQSAPADEGVK